MSPEQVQAIITTNIVLLPNKAHDLKGLRLDLTIEDPGTGETKWIDVSAAHTSCDSYVEEKLQEVVERLNNRDIAQDVKVPDIVTFKPGPTLVALERKKREKYSRLVMIARKQFNEGKRRALPEFMPFALANNGELAPEALVLQEWIVEKFRLKRQAEGSRPDGFSVNQLVTQIF